MYRCLELRGLTSHEGSFRVQGSSAREAASIDQARGARTLVEDHCVAGSLGLDGMLRVRPNQDRAPTGYPSRSMVDGIALGLMSGSPRELLP